MADARCAPAGRPASLVIRPVGDVIAVLERARSLSARLDAPLVSDDPEEGFVLQVREGSLALCLWPPAAAGSARAPSPIAITPDFLGGTLARRQREPGFLAQPLCRALGVRRGGDGPWVVADATAGLGRDAALLLYAGCTVHAVERSALLVVLLEDAWLRACGDPALGARFRTSFHIHAGDARDWLRARYVDGAALDAVYIDPMFPERRKSALVKKDMQLLQQLHGSGGDGDAAEERVLWEEACALARERVVVKRPVHAPPLARGVNHAVTGGTVRYDVYLTGSRPTG